MRTKQQEKNKQQKQMPTQSMGTYLVAIPNGRQRNH